MYLPNGFYPHSGRSLRLRGHPVIAAMVVFFEYDVAAALSKWHPKFITHEWNIKCSFLHFKVVCKREITQMFCQNESQLKIDTFSFMCWHVTAIYWFNELHYFKLWMVLYFLLHKGLKMLLCHWNILIVWKQRGLCNFVLKKCCNDCL